MRDTIYRDEAIEAVVKWMGWGKDLAGWSKIKSIIDAIPSAEAEEHRIYKDGYNTGKAHASADAVQEWIPCSERLPNESGWYVISVVGFENITDVSYFYSDESKWSDVSHTQSVVAWMPLPTPYKGGKEE